MQEIIDALETSSDVDYLIDTCFLLHMIEKGHSKALIDFCSSNKTGISTFNLAEIVHVHHKLKGTVNHHLRDFLKQKATASVPVPVKPGDREAEKRFVSDFDDKLLQTVHDPSDAVLLVLALKLRANVLTRDKHHIFTVACENYLQEYGIKVENELPLKDEKEETE